MLNSPLELKKLISLKRKEEKARIGGINPNKNIIDFEYLKLNFNDNLIKAFDKMQKIYILNEESKLTIENVKESLKELLNFLKLI